MAITALVLGIISIVVGIFFSGSLGWLGLICGILGVIFGILGKKDLQRKGIATAGIVCSIIGIVLTILLYLACVACLGGIAAALS